LSGLRVRKKFSLEIFDSIPFAFVKSSVSACIHGKVRVESKPESALPKAIETIFSQGIQNNKSPGCHEDLMVQHHGMA